MSVDDGGCQPRAPRESSCERAERGDAVKGNARRERESFRGRDADAQSGESAWPEPHDDAIDLFAGHDVVELFRQTNHARVDQALAQ